VLNTVLDLLFVLAFGMGVDGVAYATVLAQILSALMIMITLTKEKGNYGIRWRKIRIDRDSLRQILRIGLPSSIQSAITAFSNVFVQSYINYFGSACMAGYGVYNKIDAFVLIPVQSISMSSTTFVGQNWGAAQPERAREGVRVATLMSIAATVTLGALVYALARPLMGFFSPEAEVVDYGIRFIHIVTPFYIAICFNQIYAGALRGVEDATMPTVIMLISFVAFRQVYLAVTKALGAGFLAVALAYPVGWILCSTLLIIRYSRSVLVRGTGP
jgi:putative MATE family efflux protein